jgi:hypothetical protein
MIVTLTPNAERALHRQMEAFPGQHPEEIIEQALIEYNERLRAVGSDLGPHEEFLAWLQELRSSAGGDLRDETFHREMMYGDRG